METVSGTVAELVHDWGQGAGAIRMDGDNGKPVKCIGPVAGLEPGQSVELSGWWKDHPTFGRQLAVQTVKVGRPVAGPGLEKWLALTPGIGPMTAASIVERFGAETLAIIEENSNKLLSVEGIGEAKAKAIAKAIKGRTARDELWQRLVDHQVPVAAISKVVRRYGDKAAEVVERAPYSLMAVKGIGWSIADQVASSNPGFSPGMGARIRAGVIETLTQASRGGGHCFLPHRTLLVGKPKLMGACRLMKLKEATVDRQIPRMAEWGHLDVEAGGVYLPKLHGAEVVLAGRLAALAAAELPALTGEYVPANGGAEVLGREQQEALDSATREPVTVITGGPGTGKTYTTRAIVDFYRAAGLSVELAAPTGRAAKRLSEATGVAARTIHRLLEYSPREGFGRDRYSPLCCQALVVDEFSMVDVDLGSRLLDAVPVGCRLVIVGDVDQLPSVGPGAVLADIIRSTAVHVVRLTEVYRQAKGSRIIVNSHRFVKGQPLFYPEPGEDSDFYLFKKNDADDIREALREFMLERIPQKFGFDPLRDVMVLTPQNTTALGTAKLNQYLQGLMNPNGQSLGGRMVRVGDRVMQVKNNYALDVFNGDVGRVLAWDSRAKEARVDMGDRIIDYGKEHLGALVPAYASTVHKYQGSEIPCVIGIVHTMHSWMLRRNLIYTMLTRAQKLLVLIGQRSALELASANTSDSQRFTRLSERLVAIQPDELPPLPRAESIVDRVWVCDECMESWNPCSPVVNKCPECGETEKIRELRDDG